MGYDLHITRKAEWSSAGDDIPSSEWQALVATDPSLKIMGEVAADTGSGASISYKSENLALWSGHPSGVEIPFDFRKGRIVVKNPDGPILKKMLSLAERLQAKVQGDEGEVYTLQETHGIPLEGAVSGSQPGVPGWAFILGAVGLVLAVFLARRLFA